MDGSDLVTWLPPHPAADVDDDRLPAHPGWPAARTDLVAALTAAWLSAKRSAHTRRGYRRDLADWLGWCATRRLDPLRVRMADVDTWITAQRAGGPGAAPAAESSIARRVAAVSSWYGYLIRNTAGDPQPLLTHNPAHTDARPRPDPDFSPTVGLTREEVRRLRAAAAEAGPQPAALVGLLVVGGLRVGSVLAARIEDLGTDRGHRVMDLVVKRGHRRRTVVPPSVGAALDEMLAARGHPASGPLFVTAGGTPMYQAAVYRLVRRLARLAGIATAGQLSPHSLRHTAITELLDASGGDLRRAQDFAGHADPRTTRRYDRARNNLDQHGAYLLASRFADDD